MNDHVYAALLDSRDRLHARMNDFEDEKFVGPMVRRSYMSLTAQWSDLQNSLWCEINGVLNHNETDRLLTV